MHDNTTLAAAGGRLRRAAGRILEIREIVILLLVLLLSAFMAVKSPQSFLTSRNFHVVGNYMANDMIIGAF